MNRARVLLLATPLLLANRMDPGFPAAGPLEPDLTTHLTWPGGETLTLDFVRFKPKPGLSEAAIPEWCGVTIGAANAPPQSLVTIGTAHTALVTCDNLSEAGIAHRHDGTPEIAAIYNTSTPGGTSTAPVLLSRDSNGRFTLDEPTIAALPHRADIATLAELQRLLSAM